jgi:hypothetical protein
MEQINHTQGNEMNKNFVMRIYVKDGRCKSGERIHRTHVFKDTDEQCMEKKMIELQSSAYPTPKHRFEIDFISHATK